MSFPGGDDGCLPNHRFPSSAERIRVSHLHRAKKYGPLSRPLKLDYIKAAAADEQGAPVDDNEKMLLRGTLTPWRVYCFICRHSVSRRRALGGRAGSREHAAAVALSREAVLSDRLPFWSTASFAAPFSGVDESAAL